MRSTLNYSQLKIEKIMNAESKVLQAHIYFPMLEAYQRKTKELETAAGIFWQSERAREGSFIPLSFSNPEMTNAHENIAFEHDAVRRRLRDVYFTVQDKKLRIKLIDMQLSIDKLTKEWERAETYRAEKLVRVFQSKDLIRSYISLVIMAIIFIVIGEIIFNTTGALIGIVIAAFFSVVHISSVKDKRKQELEKAVNSLNTLNKRMLRLNLSPNTFEENEVLSGERSEQADSLSAWANVCGSRNFD
jgi:hypothetical protein